MKLSIQNKIVDDVSDARAIKLLHKAGFKYMDWNLKRYYLDSPYVGESIADATAYFTKMRARCAKYGIKVCQTHSLFPTYMTEQNELKIFAGMENCFLATSLLGARYTVVHPMMPVEWEGEEYRDMRIEKNIKFYNEITPLAHKYNVMICIENMFGTLDANNNHNETSCSRYEDMLAIINGVEDRSVFGFCFDSGHANICYPDKIDEEIKALGKDIKIVHLHDNNNVTDVHRLPREGNIDWDTLMKSLKDIGFDGVYDFEIASTNMNKLFKLKELKSIQVRLNKFLKKYDR